MSDAVRKECDGCSKTTGIVRYRQSFADGEVIEVDYCQSCAAHDRRVGIRTTRFPAPPDPSPVSPDAATNAAQLARAFPLPSTGDEGAES